MDAFNEFKYTFSGLFKSMEIAEAVISEYKKKNTRHSDLIQQSFCILFPTFNMSKVSDRILKGRTSKRDIEYATDAEIMICLSEASLKSPLEYDHVVLYGKIFKKIFPENDIIEEKNYSCNYRAGEIYLKLKKVAKSGERWHRFKESFN